MKKIFVLILILLLMATLSAAANKKNKTEAFLEGGVVTHYEYPLFASLGFSINLPMGQSLCFTPEFNILARPSFVAGAPALMLNLKSGSFFIGGGISGLFAFDSDVEENHVVFKVNAGIIGKKFKFTVFYMKDAHDKGDYVEGLFGFILGYRLKI